MEKWSITAWEAVRSIYASILELPFVQELAEGSLPKEKFMHYIRQDDIYLREYGKVLTHIASRIESPLHAEAFIRFASDGIEVEKALHRGFLGSSSDMDIAISPACMLYTSFLKSKSYDSVEVEAATVLPCFWIYQRVGQAIYEAQKKMSNPYKSWIDSYADAGFEHSTLKAIEICDTLAENATEVTRKAMTDAFVSAARMEWMFWDSAYKLEKWEI